MWKVYLQCPMTDLLDQQMHLHWMQLWLPLCACWQHWAWDKHVSCLMAEPLSVWVKTQPGHRRRATEQPLKRSPLFTAQLRAFGVFHEITDLKTQTTTSIVKLNARWSKTSSETAVCAVYWCPGLSERGQMCRLEDSLSRGGSAPSEPSDLHPALAPALT